MKIAILGYGKMGHEIERVAKLKGIEVKSIIDPQNPEAMHKEINKESLAEVDVVIDFTAPSAVVENVRRVSKLGKNMVVATTGWYEHLGEVKKIVNESKIGFVYSSNFSIGVSAYLKIIEAAARIFNKITDYDAYGFELHHNQKVDSPSGTAKSIAEVLIKNIDKLNPKFVLSFGLASVDHGHDKEIINLEQCGMNLNDATIPDTAGSLRRKQLIDNDGFQVPNGIVFSFILDKGNKQ